MSSVIELLLQLSAISSGFTFVVSDTLDSCTAIPYFNFHVHHCCISVTVLQIGVIMTPERLLSQESQNNELSEYKPLETRPVMNVCTGAQPHKSFLMFRAQ